MKLKNFIPTSSLIVFALILSIICISNVAGSSDRDAKASKAPVISPTSRNLMIAYNGQLHAKEKFLAFAKKADKEGYLKAGQLFRAAANSVEIHARNTAKALTDLGITPAATVRKHKVRSTKENLSEAIKSDGYKSEKLFPKFLKQAKTDNTQAAVIAFGSMAKVDANRKILFQNALINLENYKAATKGFYVCQICGNVVEVIDFTDCPVCGYPTSEYKQIP